MKKITEYCKKFNKRPASFLDNPNIKLKIPKSEYNIVKGPRGFTEIHEKHLKEFFLWLHPTTRQMVLDGKTIEEIQQYLTITKNYPIMSETIKEN